MEFLLLGRGTAAVASDVEARRRATRLLAPRLPTACGIKTSRASHRVQRVLSGPVQQRSLLAAVERRSPDSEEVELGDAFKKYGGL